MKTILTPLYYRLPPSWRRSRKYRQISDFYRTAQWWSKEEIIQWQVVRLRKIVHYAYESVPGYQQLYREAGITPDAIRGLEDIKHLPFTHKELFRDNLSDFTSSAITPWRRRYVTTGGSTGIPFGFYSIRENRAIEDAFMHTAWGQAGWKINDVGIILRGGYVGAADRLFSKLRGERYALSTYYLTESTYPAYREFIKKLRPSFMHAYPSSAADFARMVLEAGDQGALLFESIFIGSENFYEWQKKLIKEAFSSAKLLSWYGHTEKTIWAPWCESAETYHICPFYGFTELIGNNDEEVLEGGIGELVGTSFWMEATPFIRYRTMDYARRGMLGCVLCGRNFQLLESIEGRLQEIIISGTGRRISMTSINMHDNTFDEVAQFRFVQRDPGQLELLVVPRSAYSAATELKILQSIGAKLGDDFILSVIKVKEICRSKSGKFSFLEQHLEIDHSDRI